jgi:hypothetical protein
MVIFNFLNENLPIPYKRFFIFIIKGIQKFLNNKNKISKLLDKIIYKIELTQD